MTILEVIFKYETNKSLNLSPFSKQVFNKSDIRKPLKDCSEMVHSNNRDSTDHGVLKQLGKYTYVTTIKLN